MVGFENLPQPLSQNSILGKKSGGAPQIRQKFNHHVLLKYDNKLGYGSNFQGNLRITNQYSSILFQIKGENPKTKNSTELNS